MTPGQWEEIVVEVESLWGRSAKWSKADRAYKHIKTVDFRAASNAVEDFFNAGREHAPSISELVARARRYAGPVKASPCNGHHPQFAIVERTFEHTTVVCTACGEQEQRPPDFLTVGELEEAAR